MIHSITLDQATFLLNEDNYNVDFTEFQANFTKLTEIEKKKWNVPMILEFTVADEFKVSDWNCVCPEPKKNF